MGFKRASGITIDRRGFLIVGAAASIAPPELVWQDGQARAASVGDLTFDEFTSLARAELKELLPAAGADRQDAFVHRAGALLQRLQAIPPQEFNDTRQMDIRLIEKPMVFAITVLRGLPGAVLPAHNHPLYSVATMGLSGEVRVRNFEHEAAPPPYESTERFKIRQTSEHMLGARDVVTLTPERDNIHIFEAGPSGALWLDLSTPHADPSASKFSYLRLFPGPNSRVGDTYEGQWGRD